MKTNNKKDELADLTHLAKNVVCNILGACEIIEMEEVQPPNESVDEMIADIKSSATELLQVIQQIVALVDDKR